jgi:hypothetical protein
MNEKQARTFLARRGNMDQAIFDEHEIEIKDQISHYFSCITISAFKYGLDSEDVGLLLLEFVADKLDFCVDHLRKKINEECEKEIQE